MNGVYNCPGGAYVITEAPEVAGDALVSDDGVIHHPAVYEPGEEPSGRQPTLYELGILMAFHRLGKAMYEGTAAFDPHMKRKRRARQAARRHQRVR